MCQEKPRHFCDGADCSYKDAIIYSPLRRCLEESTTTY